MLLWETDESDPGYSNDGASEPTEGVSKRHTSGSIIGVMDGHVDYVK